MSPTSPTAMIGGSKASRPWASLRVAWAKEDVNPSQTGKAFSSSGHSVNKNAPVVRLRWTDRNLVSLVANEEVVLTRPPQRCPSATASAVRHPGSAAVARHQSRSPLRSLSKRRDTVEPPVILRWISEGQIAARAEHTHTLDEQRAELDAEAAFAAARTIAGNYPKLTGMRQRRARISLRSRWDSRSVTRDSSIRVSFVQDPWTRDRLQPDLPLALHRFEVLLPQLLAEVGWLLLHELSRGRGPGTPWCCHWHTGISGEHARRTSPEARTPGTPTRSRAGCGGGVQRRRRSTRTR